MAKMSLLSFLLVVAVSCIAIGSAETDHVSFKHVPSTIDVNSRLQHYKVWKDNVRYIEEHNSKKSTFKLGVNKFTHLLSHQMPKMNRQYTINKSTLDQLMAPFYGDVPSAVDWRVKGDVAPVHNQGELDCSFEIAFADAVTSFNAINTGHLTPFSPQQLMDCCTRDCKCNTLLEPGQLAYCIKKHGGLCPDYPTNKSECECQKCNEKKVMIHGVREVHSGNETALKHAVAMEPVLVVVDASHDSFQLYKEGIYREPSCSQTKLDHFLLVVGYGTDDQGMDYWLCKNSWGTEWGMQGYILIARNANNMCGIATSAFYPY